MANTLRRVYSSLCIVVGIIALGAQLATMDAVVGKWPRSALFAIFIFSLSAARQLWKGLSAAKDEPNQPSASSRTDLIVREGLGATKDEPHQRPTPQRDDSKDLRDTASAAKDSDQLGFWVTLCLAVAITFVAALVVGLPFAIWHFLNPNKQANEIFQTGSPLILQTTLLFLAARRGNEETGNRH
jgi:hypothetical protein